MAVFENYPYTNLHNLNLDYLIKNIKKNADDIEYITDNIGTAAESAEAAAAYARLAQEAAESVIEKPRRVVCIGDSYASGWTPDGNNDGWPIYLKNSLNIAEDNFAHAEYGGIGFAYTVDGKNFTTMLSEITISDRASVTDVIVAGGFNDQYSTDNAIAGGIQTFVAAARVIFPIAKIHIAFIGKSYRTGNDIANLRRALAAYSQGAIANNVLFMNGVENFLQPEMLASDYVHPLAAGNIAIAAGIRQALITGAATYAKSVQSSLTPINGTFEDDQIYTNINGNLTDHSITILRYIPATPITKTFNGSDNSAIDIATLPINANAKQPSSQPLSYPVNVMFQYDGYKYLSATGYFYLAENTLKLNAILTNDAHSNFLTLNNISSIQIRTRATWSHSTL